MKTWNLTPAEQKAEEETAMIMETLCGVSRASPSFGFLPLCLNLRPVSVSNVLRQGNWLTHKKAIQGCNFYPYHATNLQIWAHIQNQVPKWVWLPAGNLASSLGESFVRQDCLGSNLFASCWRKSLDIITIALFLAMHLKIAQCAKYCEQNLKESFYPFLLE